jgi:hypothetical protein
MVTPDSPWIPSRPSQTADQYSDAYDETAINLAAEVDFVIAIFQRAFDEA